MFVLWDKWLLATNDFSFTVTSHAGSCYRQLHPLFNSLFILTPKATLKFCITALCEGNSLVDSKSYFLFEVIWQTVTSGDEISEFGKSFLETTKGMITKICHDIENTVYKKLTHLIIARPISHNVVSACCSSLADDIQTSSNESELRYLHMCFWTLVCNMETLSY